MSVTWREQAGPPQARRAHRARGQARDAHELDDVLGTGAREHVLERGIGVALAGDRERGAELHRRGAHRDQLAHTLVRVDAAGGNERDRALVDALGAEERVRLRDHALEVEARIGQIVDASRAQVAAGVARVLDHDRVGQPAQRYAMARRMAGGRILARRCPDRPEVERHRLGIGQDEKLQLRAVRQDDRDRFVAVPGELPPQRIAIGHMAVGEQPHHYGAGKYDED